MSRCLSALHIWIFSLLLTLTLLCLVWLCWISERRQQYPLAARRQRAPALKTSNCSAEVRQNKSVHVQRAPRPRGLSTYPNGAFVINIYIGDGGVKNPRMLRRRWLCCHGDKVKWLKRRRFWCISVKDTFADICVNIRGRSLGGRS